MRPNLIAPAILATLAAVPALAQAPAGGETLAADSPRTTSAGHTFTAPAGFTIATRANLVTLQAPEKDATVAIVDAQAANGDEAIAKAWQAYRGGMKWPVKLCQPAPDVNGWTDRRTCFYETSPNERATVIAAARRAGDAWVGIVIDASDATMEKRNAAIGLMLGSLRPKGYQRETFAGRTPKPLDAAKIEVLKQFVADGAKKLGIPGVGFSLIDGNKVVFEGGVGVRALGKPEPVDARTLFVAASNTKSMTTLLMAQAVDEGLMSWDQPVTEVYPRFRLGDAGVTNQLKVKHLACACTGLPRQDMEWLFGNLNTRADVVFDALATMTPTSRIGEAFQYSNLMVGAAGYVAAAKMKPGAELGGAYDDAMRTRIFAPLGMADTTFDFDRALKANHAQPHAPDVDGRTEPATLALTYTIIPARPAGGVWTSAHDMSRYVLMELGRGQVPGGPRIVSEKNLTAREQPQISTGEDSFYGLGLFGDKRLGVPIYGHGGDMPGYHSAMFWLPQHGIGGTILTNADPGWLLRGPFQRKVLELVFDGKPEADAQIEAAARNYFDGLRKERQRLVLPADGTAVGKLAASYVNPQLGAVKVERKGAETEFDFGPWRSRMATRKNDDGTISFITVSPAVGGFEFVVAEEAGKRQLVLRDSQHEYKFAEAGR